MFGYIANDDFLRVRPARNMERSEMNLSTRAAETTTRNGKTRLRRRLATFAARCAMGSWVVLAAMPVAVVVFSIA